MAKFANYTGIKNKKPIKVRVFIEDGLEAPAFVKHLGITYKKVSKVEDTKDAPAKGDLVLKKFSDAEVKQRAEKDAEQFMKDLEENPDVYENAEELSKKPKTHWVSEFSKVYKRTGNISTIS